MYHEKLYPSSYWEYLGTQVIYKVGRLEEEVG